MSGFVDTKDEDMPSPNVFLQWKGTDVCMDFHCACGAHCHFDGYFASVVECPHCHKKYEMPCMLYPRPMPLSYSGNVKMLEPDEDHSDEVEGPDGITRWIPHLVIDSTA